MVMGLLKRACTDKMFWSWPDLTFSIVFCGIIVCGCDSVGCVIADGGMQEIQAAPHASEIQTYTTESWQEM